MVMELRQSLKLAQQLKMTPQLQQAIKLLQLSRMELVQLVRQEMEENPVLEEGIEATQEDTSEKQSEQTSDMGMEGLDQERSQIVETSNETVEVAAANGKGDQEAAKEIDWESYLEHYSTGPQAPSYRQNNEDLPSLEATLTRKPSLFDHLAWQLTLSDLNEEDVRVGMMIMGNLDQNGYLKA
ncbi:MAG: RNA polymerase sigma-54 factor, partial [Pseudomonadota bacterium]